MEYHRLQRMGWHEYSAGRLVRAGLALVFASLLLWMILHSKASWLDSAFFLFFVAGAGAFTWEAFSESYRWRLFPERSYVVSFDEDEVRLLAPSGTASRVRWSDLEEVSIRTTGQGPFVADSFLQLLSPDASCIVPLGAQGFQPLLQRLQQLPGFDNESAIAASGSTRDAVFRCWHKGAVERAR